MTSAIYYQKSAVVQEEFKLIELATIREMVVEKLQRVIRAVKEHRREMDDETILEMFTLMNQVRNSTVDLIRCIAVWQESFTKNLRPKLFDCDYIVDRMIDHIDFVNSSNIKRVFNFQFYRGNALLLPYPNPKTIDPIRINSALATQVRAFASPPEDVVMFCYQFFINCLPDEVYQNKLAPLKRWLMAGWIPRVWISTNPSPAVSNGNGRNSGTASRSSNKFQQKQNRQSQNSGKLSTASKKSNTTTGGSLSPHQQRRKMLQQQSGTASAGPTKIKRRNQLAAAEAEQLQKFRNLDGTNGAGIPVDGISREDAGRQLGEGDELPVGNTASKARDHQTAGEMKKLDAYFEEMELLFIPTLGRRAVQTVVVGGSSHINPAAVGVTAVGHGAAREGGGGGNNKGSDGTNSVAQSQQHEVFFHQPERIMFAHSHQEQQKMLDNILQQPGLPEHFQRANPENIARRNRILAARRDVEGDRDKEYTKHNGTVSARPAGDRNSKKSEAKKGINDAKRGGNDEDEEYEEDEGEEEDDEESEGDEDEEDEDDNDVGFLLVGEQQQRERRRSRRASNVSRSRRISDITMDTLQQEELRNRRHGKQAARRRKGVSANDDTEDENEELGDRDGAAAATAVITGTGSSSPGEGAVLEGLHQQQTTAAAAAGTNTNTNTNTGTAKRRSSRRMSDLTVTFSIDGGSSSGGGDGDGDGADGEEVPLSKVRGSSAKVRSAAGKKVSVGGAGTGTGLERRDQAVRSSQRSGGGGGGGGDTSEGEITSTSVSRSRNRRSTPQGSSAGALSTNDGSGKVTTIYGTVKSTGPLPPASTTLRQFDTRLMRHWFADQEKVELHSNSTNERTL